MKHKLFAALFALSIAISGLAGFSVNANAANTSDVDYSFQNVNYDGYTLSRLKEDYTKVYVYPHSGPELKYTVQGALYALLDGLIDPQHIKYIQGLKQVLQIM